MKEFHWCRFDLIYLVLDKAKREDDEKLARHLVSLYYEEQLPSAQVQRPPTQNCLNWYMLALCWQMQTQQ